MIIAIPVTAHGQVDPRWGKAHTVAVAEVRDDEIVSWNEHEVAWDVSHELSGEGSHHARVVTFLRENGVEAVIIDHCGAPMLNMLTKMKLVIATDAEGDAKKVVIGTAPLIRAARENQSTLIAAAR